VEFNKHPQEIINRQVLAQCDLLVGAFWTRLGTPTPAHQSGTVEEIERHIAAGKPTMLYFSGKPVAPDSIDPMQYAKLKEFKASCRERGLYVQYDNVEGFKDEFTRHLQLKLNQEGAFTAVTESSFWEAESASPPMPALSHEAKLLLKSASRDQEGIVLRQKLHGGIMLVSERREFISTVDPREAARWEAALKQLYAEALLEDVKGGGIVSKITARGYEVADLIEE
jgi:hypothetical protein